MQALPARAKNHAADADAVVGGALGMTRPIVLLLGFKPAG